MGIGIHLKMITNKNEIPKNHRNILKMKREALFKKDPDFLDGFDVFLIAIYTNDANS